MTALEVSQLAVIAGGMLAIPSVVAALPEPPAPDLPAEGSAEETALDRILREEGPQETYADMALHLRKGWWAIWPLLFLSGWSISVVPVRLGWVATALVPVFALLVCVDWRRRLLPRIVVLPLTAVVTALAVIDWIVRRDTDALIREAAGGAVAWSIFGLMWFIRKAGMGLGDVRLALPLGILMAAASWNAWLIGLYASFFLFVLFAFGLLLVKRDRHVLKKAYPFGPFMIAGAYLGLALGTHVHLIG